MAKPKDGFHMEHITPTVSMPSSDLITYRFDQTDKKIDALDRKFGEITSIYATKEELTYLTRRIDNYTWYWRTVFGSLLVITGGVILALLQKK